MPTLKGLLEEAAKGHQLMVVGPHTQWLETPENDRLYTEAAITFVTDAMAGKYKKARPGRLSPSGLGDCQRRVLFSYAGAPALGENPDTHELFGLGNWGHYKWQAEGLSMGWLAQAEVWQHRPELNMGGSLDGVLEDDSIFELKTTRSFIYNRIVSRERTPKWEHLLQLHGYLALTERNWASLVYEDRDSGNYHEYRIERDQKIDTQLHQRLDRLNDHISDDTLPVMLDDCELRQGKIYHSCPFRKYCPTATQITLAGD